jgi:hypothetical protein
MELGQSYASQPASIEPQPAPQNFFSRLIGVYFSPGETFAEIGRAPGVVLPLIALILLTLASSYFVSTRVPVERIAEQRLEQAIESGQISAEQAERQREGLKRFMPLMKIFIPLSAVLFAVLLPLAIAGGAKLVSVVMGIENKFMPLWAVAIYAILAIAILTTVVFIALLYLKPVDEFDWNNPLGSNLAAILGLFGLSGLPKFVNALLSFVDVFYIWRVILLGIGFAAVSRKLKASTAIAYTGGVAFLVALIGAGWAALFG